MIWPGVAGAAAGALLAGLATGPVLRRLPEPAPEPDEAPKLPYATLATPGFAVAVATASLLAGLVVAWRSGGACWWAAVIVGALAVAIDARTTYLPLRLAHAAWLGTGVGLGWQAWASHDAAVPLRALVGAAVAGLLMLLAWRFLGTGFGDVRLMTVLGACATAHSWDLLQPTLLLATAVGAGWGIMTRLRGRRGAFPYGPGLWAGTFLALALLG